MSKNVSHAIPSFYFFFFFFLIRNHIGSILEMKSGLCQLDLPFRPLQRTPGGLGGWFLLLNQSKCITFLLIFPVLIWEPQLFLQTCLLTGVILSFMQSIGSQAWLGKMPIFSVNKTYNFCLGSTSLLCSGPGKFL